MLTTSSNMRTTEMQQQKTCRREAPTLPPPPPGLAAEELDARAYELEAFARRILARSHEMRNVAQSIRNGHSHHSGVRVCGIALGDRA